MAAPATPTQIPDDASVEDQIGALLGDDLETIDGPADPEKGEAPDDDPDAKAAPDDEPEEKPDDEPDDEPEEKPDDEPDDKGEGKDEPDAIETLADLAKEFDVDEATLTNHLQIEIADGENVPLSSVIAAYKDAPRAAEIAREVETEREALTARGVELTKKESEGIQELAAVTDVLLTQIEGEEKIDWARLEAEDKLLYLTKREEFQRKRGAIAQGIQKLRAHETEQAGVQQREKDEFGIAEARKVAAAHPDWVNSAGRPNDVGIAAAKQIDAYLISQGYTQEDIDEQLVDHRQIQIAWKASEFDRLETKVKLRRREGAKKPSKGRKTLTARSTRPAGTRSTERSQKLRRRLANTGSDEDAAAAILDVIDLD